MSLVEHSPTKQDQPDEGPPRVAPTSKTIVLFADGTGNAFSKQESNVWRLYDMLDLGSSAQIAYYIPGVGTSGFRPWALIDGATGLGVPANVRKLYEFLCWNYEPGDRIYMFGFSRGAFTIRALIGLIDSEGLLSRTGTDGIASRPEMRRNAMSAWRAYRAKRRRSLRHEAPTIKLTRLVRNAMLFVRDHLFRYERYAQVRARSVRDVTIPFVGLFDTVEAYGVPLEEMRDAIDWAIWPIRFQNRDLSPLVTRVRHALSLDDERQTFHPVRFDQTKEKTGRIEEVWFAGVHSDVGGGYPDDAAALVPLCWMLDGVAHDLVFEPDTLRTLRSAASSLAAIHDSRSGLGNFYRYFPRVIGLGPAEGGPPVVHHSVMEKMVYGGERYAPHALPARLEVLMPDGSRRPMQGMRTTASMKAAHGPGPRPDADAMAAAAVARIQSPVTDFVDSMQDGVWLRRKVYFLLLAACLVFVSLPWTASLVGIGPAACRKQTLEAACSLAQSNDVLQALVANSAAAIANFIPGYLQPWFRVAVAQPLVTLAVVVCFMLLYGVNQRLRDQIADDARCAWFQSGGKARRGPFRRLASLLRRRGPAAAHGVAYWFWFTTTLAAFTVGVVFFADRMVLSYRVGAGHVCTVNRTQTPRSIALGKPETAEGFKPEEPCWDTGLIVEKGEAYSLTIEMTTPFRDRSIVADLDGFDDRSLVHWVAAPLKRWFTAAYFQPIARIDGQGMTEWVLTPTSGEEPRVLGKDALVPLPAHPSGGACAQVPAETADVAAIVQKLGLQGSLTSRFVAQKSGELFLYVNDAAFGTDTLARLLGLGDRYCFYKNNAGLARVVVSRL